MKLTSYLLIFFCFLGIYLSSCSARRIEKEMAASKTENPKITEGRLVFKNKCQKCHPNGENGVGPEINNIPLPGFAIKARVRSRAFLLWTGRMPQFNKQEITPKELTSLVAYVKMLRKKNSKKQ